MIPIVTGLAAGGLHVFSGADHMAALAPLAVQNPAHAGRTGAYWGIGHGLGVVFVGAIGLWLRGLIDLESWSSWAEFAVGFLLVIVGLWAFWRASRMEIHAHPHDHESEAHAHLHAHEPGSRLHAHAAVGVGTLHGIAGSGHLYGVIPALALPTSEAIVYLAAYLIAAMASMSGFAYFLGVVAKRGGPASVRRFMFASASLAIGVGVAWIIRSWPT